MIEEVLDEIAKYTIGDADDIFDSDHWNDTDSNATQSTEFDEDADIDGLAMLRIVSILPEAPNPNILSSDHERDAVLSSSDDDDEEDLEMAKASLYGRSYTIDTIEPYSGPLEPIEEQVIERTVSIDKEAAKSKGDFLTTGDSSDCKVSSDANNSDLP